MQSRRLTYDSYYRDLVNGSHYNENDTDYYEWWYFQFVSDSGFAANIVLHETDIFALEKNPYISISLRLPDGKAKHGRTSSDIDRENTTQSFKDLCFDGGVCLNSKIIEGENHIKMTLNFFDDIYFETQIRKQYAPIVINDGVLYYDPKFDGKSYWTVNIPFGTCEVKLKVEGHEYKFDCFVYHDHQWGNLPVQNFASDWVWGNFCDSRMSLIFFIILTNGGIINRQALISKDKIFITSGKIKHNPCYLIDTSLNVENIDSATKMSQILLDWGEDIYFLLNPSNILRSRINEKHPGFEATYLQWVSCGIYSEHPSMLLYGITEYMRIRKGGKNER